MTLNCGTIWTSVSEVIRQRISADGYERWFQGVDVVSDDGLKLVFRVPNPIHQFFIESNYLRLVQDAAQEVLQQSAEDPVCRSGKCGQRSLHIPLSEHRSPAATRHGSRAFAWSNTSTSGMNPRNTFDTFVVGSNNQFAHGAAIAVAKISRQDLQPFLCLRRKRLGQDAPAPGDRPLRHNSHKSSRVVYLSSEQFTNEFIDAIQHGTLVKFRKKYRYADILMIDDIQFLAGKERSQEEFFHTFNTLHDGHKQIVLSSDRPASEIEKLEQRLVSRFEWGMTAELQPPDIETRIAILKKKAESLNIALEPWVIEFLADRIRNNVRRLEGALMRVASYKSLSDREITREVIENLLRDIFQEQARRAVTIEQIQRKVAEHFDVRLADMTSKRRPANIAFPRQVAMFLSRELTNSSLSDIGDAFGGKDHGTVIHACKLVKRRIEEDEQTRHVIRLLDSQLQR